MNYTDFLHCILMIWCRKEETFIDFKAIISFYFHFFSQISFQFLTTDFRSFVMHLFSGHLNL